MRKILAASLSWIVQLALLCSTFAWANEDELGFDRVVAELRQTTESQPASQSDHTDPFQNVTIHGGIGVSASYMAIKAPNEVSGAGLLKGFEAYFGVDLFSPEWMAEGAFRSYAPDEISREIQASLTEFDLKVLYRPPLSRTLRLRTGFGLAARYLEIETQKNSQKESFEASTPSWLFIMGVDSRLGKVISLGPFIAYRAALIENSLDRSGVDFGLRVNAHF